MKTLSILVLPVMLLLLPGCVARTAANVVTLPVRAGSQAVDWTTTSQDEADRNAGRKMRKQQERDDRERQRAEKERQRQCRAAGHGDCR